MRVERESEVETIRVLMTADISSPIKSLTILQILSLIFVKFEVNSNFSDVTISNNVRALLGISLLFSLISVELMIVYANSTFCTKFDVQMYNCTSVLSVQVVSF